MVNLQSSFFANMAAYKQAFKDDGVKSVAEIIVLIIFVLKCLLNSPDLTYHVLMVIIKAI